MLFRFILFYQSLFHCHARGPCKRSCVHPRCTYLVCIDPRAQVWVLGIGPVRWMTDRQTNRQTDRQTDRQTNGRTDRQTNKQRKHTTCSELSTLLNSFSVEFIVAFSFSLLHLRCECLMMLANILCVLCECLMWLKSPALPAISSPTWRQPFDSSTVVCGRILRTGLLISAVASTSKTLASIIKTQRCLDSFFLTVSLLTRFLVSLYRPVDLVHHCLAPTPVYTPEARDEVDSTKRKVPY